MSSLTERLEAHARLHDAFYPPDEEQAQWAADLREAIEAVRERDELARQRGELASRVIELQASLTQASFGSITEDDLFVLIGHAEGLLADGQHDMPTYFYGLVCRLARHVGGGELTQRMEELRASRTVNVASDSQPSEAT